MGSDKEVKRKKDKRDIDDDNRKEKKSKRARTRSRSPGDPRERDSGRKRRRSRSVSPEKPLKQEKIRDGATKDAEVKQEPPVRKTKETDMLNTRTGGAYIPPARLRLMQAQITDKSSVPFQRLAWEALKKSIHGHINKINVGNIGIIIKELLKENIVRGRGLLCRSVIQAQAASPTFTNVYAALVAAVNSRFPNIGELLLKRLVIQFKRGFKRNDKPICISSASFIAHLVNQRVAHEILALELLTLLVETPTDDSIEVAISFLKECGQKLTEVSSKGVNAIFEMLRNILHEGQLDKRVQYMIEVMFQIWKDGFKDHPALIEELELVPEEEQFTHLMMLDEATDAQDILNVFKFDEKFEENENKYKTLCKEILGSDAESDEEGSDESGSEEEEEEDENGEPKPMTIIDNTETNLVALRRTVYLTINSSLDFEECAHKLMKMQLKPGQEIELCHMFLDCCAEQRTYEKFYGLLAQRFCNINRIYIGPFEEIFKDSYSTAHRLDTNRLRNVSKFFAHLLFTDSISWEVLECVRLNEEDTTSSSRIYIKILFQELAEYMGLKKLNDRLRDPTLQDAYRGVFPRDNPKNTRFSINFFTSIGLGGLTDELRAHLKQMPKPAPAQLTDVNLDSESSSSSSSSEDSSSSDSDSEDGSDKDKDKSKRKKDKNEKTAEKAPPTEPERWGHDGFYDTYGKDARRTEDTRPMDHNFAKPRDVRRNQDQRGDRNKEDNFWGKRRDDRDKRSEKRRDDNGREGSLDDRGNEKERKRNEEKSRDDASADRRNEDKDTRKDDRGPRKNEINIRRDDRDTRKNDSTRKTRNNQDENERNRQERTDDRSREIDEKTDRRKDDRDRDGRKDRNDEKDRSRERDERIDRRKDDRDGRKDKNYDNERSRERDERTDRRKDDRDRDSRKDRNYDRRKETVDDRTAKRRDDKERIDDRRERKRDGDKSRRRDDDDRRERDDSRKESSRKSKKDKERKGNKKSDSEASSEDSEPDSSSDSDESVEKGNRRREEKYDEEDYRRKKDKGKEDDGWDIRGSSIRREVPNRYWEN